jgi:hypothetical protein
VRECRVRGAVLCLRKPVTRQAVEAALGREVR